MNEEKFFVVNKNLGETPLEALERVRVEKGISEDIPMTYAGRLDPMAEGLLLILVGEECKQKQKYLDLPKVYETEILFGVETDTFDILGMPKLSHQSIVSREDLSLKLKKFVGKYIQVYPSFSSKTVDGKPLFQYIRDGEAVFLPEREVEVFGIEILSEKSKNSSEMLVEIEEKISKIKGDFRQEEILTSWRNLLKEKKEFQVFKFKISCGSGYYVRRFADSLGKEFNMGAIAYSINRTKIGPFEG